FVVGQRDGIHVQDQVARQLVIDETTRQSPFVDYRCMVNLPDEVRLAESWIRERLHEPIGVSDIARAAATSPRTLARRFQETVGRTPIQFLQHLRVQEAIRLLRSTQDPFEEIASRVGYKNTAGLRRIMARETGRLPSHYRRMGFSNA
ncbi:MAG: helix-turn-helix domain-containing protein, partial [Planctomycetota bacterium]